MGVVAAAWWRLTADDADSGGSTDSVATQSQSPTTTDETATLSLRDYERGDCVTWDERPSALGAQQDTKVVACAEPHRMEVTESATAPESVAYPSEETWEAWFETGPCHRALVQYVGGTLATESRYGPYGVKPKAAAWAQGHRKVWCGVTVFPTGPTTEPNPPFRGAIDPTDQALHYDVGVCVPPEGTEFRLLTCDQPHVAEVVGHVELPDAPAPPEGEAFFDAVESDCELLIRAYVAGPMKPPIWWTAYPISETSWRLGQRKTECLVREVDANYDDVVITRSLRAAAAA